MNKNLNGNKRNDRSLSFRNNFGIYKFHKNISFNTFWFQDSFLSSLDCENEMMCFISTNKHFVKTFMNRIRFNGGTIEYKNLSEKINCINEEIEKQIKHCICHPVKLMTIERDVIFTSAVRCKVKKFTIKCRSNAPGEPILDVKRRRNCKHAFFKFQLFLLLYFRNLFYI